jgi:transposase-like protein
MKISHLSINNYYKSFRLLCAHISEIEYEQKRNNICEYEEYFYLEDAKKLKKEAVFDAYNFLTFDYNNHIYTLLMPSLKKYKSQFIQDNVEDAFVDAFKKFKRDNKIIKLSKRNNNIITFWDYFEEKVRIYKGISAENFIYYLKEFEFKYNHTKTEALELLMQHYFKD